MDQPQKTPREMILDRLNAAQIGTHDLAVEAAGDKVRITGAVASEEVRSRVSAVLSQAAAQGIRLSSHIEVRPDGNPQKEEPEDTVLRSPAEPA